MKNNILVILSIICNAVLYNQQIFGSNLTTSQYVLDNTNCHHQCMKNDFRKLPINISSDYVNANYPNNAIFIGNVNINQGNTFLHADKVQLHQIQYNNSTKLIHTINAIGNVYYDNKQIIIHGVKSWMNMDTKDINIWNAHYQLVGSYQGQGQADLIKQREKNRYTIIINGSFTSCMENYNSWSITGSTIIFDRKEQIIKIWNAYFKIGTVSVFYSPYLQIPMGSKRRSGFLITNNIIKYSTANYFELYLPYYWNITPNVDATIIPYYINKRGNIMWHNEIRYLTHIGSGLIEIHYLPSDKIFKIEHAIKSNSDRWLFHWKHNGILNHTWHFNIDYTKVSDNYYFNDFYSQYNNSNCGYVTQQLDIDYIINNFDATICTKQFQILNDKSNKIYYAQPSLNINWYINNIGPFDTHLYVQVVHFVNTDKTNMPESIRLHFEPTINLPLMNNWINLDVETKLMVTLYQQKNYDWYNATYGSNLKGYFSRIMPIISINSSTILERNLKWMKNYTQTLEPHMQYLYIPYRDQSKVENYDSSFLYLDYSTLFHNNCYGGLDRIASANQLRTGITTRIYNNATVEYFNFSIGNIYYFSRSCTGDRFFQWEKNNKTGPLIWVSDTNWYITKYWNLHNNVQFNTSIKNMVIRNSMIEYRRDENHILQLTYRYISPKYIYSALLSQYTFHKEYKDGISQIGGTANWPISDFWSIFGSYYFDINNNKPTNQMIGLQYHSYCYAMRIGYEHKLNGWDINSNRAKYNKIISLNIELRGLSTNINPDAQQISQSKIVSYHNTFN